MRPALVAAAACLVLFVLGSCGTNASTKPAAGFLKTSGQRILDERGAPVLLRGVNLGGWLVPEGYLLKLKGQADRPRTINALVEETAGPAFAKDFWEAYRDAYVSEADIEAIAAAGFNHVRVPFNASLFLSEGPEEKWIDDGFNRLDDVIQWCSRHRLRVILDMHCAPGGQTGTNIDDDARNQPELWTDPENQRRA
ncbi:MAG: cellulase family glycosylhydrolase, partial [Verrucomicrobiae bacterium]|nr:cellulase family glycosylhydrolase [Verrucomicrobiae bacterium]